MCRKGNCRDNAVIENLFGDLEEVFFHHAMSPTIEHFMSTRRLHRYLTLHNTQLFKT